VAMNLDAIVQSLDQEIDRLQRSLTTNRTHSATGAWSTTQAQDDEPRRTGEGCRCTESEMGEGEEGLVAHRIWQPTDRAASKLAASELHDHCVSCPRARFLGSAVSTQ
jgi:hypothetical protein